MQLPTLPKLPKLSYGAGQTALQWGPVVAAVVIVYVSQKYMNAR